MGSLSIPPGGSEREPDRSHANAVARWRTIEVRHLAALVAVAHEGSFRRAADRLGYVQSAISNQIAQLERAAGTRLLDRASGSPAVRLTAAGQVFVDHAERIMARLELARADINSTTHRTDTVRIAGLEQLGPWRFAWILRTFRQRYGFARLSVEDAGDDELNLERLSAGLIDLAVCELPVIDGSFASLPLERDPYVLVVAADSPLARRNNPTTVTELASARLMIPTSGAATNRVAPRLRALGIEPQSRLQPGSAANAQGLVAAGLGEAIVPRAQFDPMNSRTAAIELPAVLPERMLGLVVHTESERSTAIRGFTLVARLSCGLNTKGDSTAVRAGQSRRTPKVPAA